MFEKAKSIYCCVALAMTGLASTPSIAETALGWPLTTGVRTESGVAIPAGAWGVVQIDTPREATLLQLRGLVGSGTVALRMPDSRDCLTLPIRFVAGDFGGDTISTRAAQPIRMVISSSRLAHALAQGDDIVSDMYKIGTMPGDPTVDLVIVSGLGQEHGFVLNPGSSILADVFGADTSHVGCTAT